MDACAVASVRAGEPTKAQIDFFENKIRPIFAGNCYKCHSPAEGKTTSTIKSAKVRRKLSSSIGDGLATTSV